MIAVTNKYNGDLLTFTPEGDCVCNEIIGSIREHYSKAKKFIIWDFSYSNLNAMTNEEFIEISEVVSSIATHEKTAYVGNLQIEFGLLNMYRAYAELAEMTPAPKVFRSKAEAEVWLGL